MAYMLTGKQMKAITAFAKGAKVMHLLNTPFFYDGHIYASDQYCALSFDLEGNSPYKGDDVVGIDAEPLMKILVKDEFTFMEDGYMTHNQEAFEMVNKTDSLLQVGKALKEMFSQEGSGVLQGGVEIMGVQPKLVKKVCDLADAFGITCMDFKVTPYKNSKHFMVTFPTYPSLKVIIMPIRK